jgi:predicted 3-demethylubiquinone-9 3-methyltransferase (glyoxalase superfamily)
MQKITTFLWFDDKAEEAMQYYTTLFPDSKLLESMPSPEGKLMGGRFQIAGQEFMVLNGGPQFKFNEAISLYVNCDDQAEVDRLWDKFIADGGEESMCGWLKDKFGLSWQIIPSGMTELISNPDEAKAGRAMQAMLKMKKIDLAEMQKAFDGEK